MDPSLRFESSLRGLESARDGRLLNWKAMKMKMKMKMAGDGDGDGDGNSSLATVQTFDIERLGGMTGEIYVSKGL